MEPFRTTGPLVPLITAIGGHLVALDPERGSRMWAQPLQRSVGRLLVAEGSVFVVTNGPEMRAPSELLVFDLLEGHPRGSMSLEFEVTHLLTRGSHVWLGDAENVVCVTGSGGLVWRATTETVAKSGWSGDTVDLVGRDGSGREMWRLPKVARRGWGALALGELVSQPDMQG